jgi:putative transposase
MPWKHTDTIDQREQFIQAVADNEGDSFAALCRRFEISRETGYQLVRRHEELGANAFQPGSQRPLHSPQAITLSVEKHVLEVRTTHPTWGARKILAYLQRRIPRATWPVASSIGDLLRRHGLTHPQRRRAHVAPFTQPLGHSIAPNDVWCTDFKGWFRTLDGLRCNPLTITDATTRMLLRCNHLRKCGFADVKPLFEATFREYGLPLAIRSDNGSPFSSIGIAGLSRLSIWWIRLGIWPERIEPGRPEQNGRHERMHRTLEQEVASAPSPNSRLQQRAFDRFRLEFNTVRPHEALGQRPPADFYVASPRNFPKTLPDISYPEEALVRSVRPNGEIKHAGRLFFLGEALAGERVALWEVEAGWDVYFGMVRLAHLHARSGKLIRLRSH